jgi:hypothetical protein
MDYSCANFSHSIATVKIYEEAGMEPDGIQAMYEFELDTFKAARVEVLHIQEFAIQESTDNGLSKCESPLFDKFQNCLLK